MGKAESGGIFEGAHAARSHYCQPHEGADITGLDAVGPQHAVNQQPAPDVYKRQAQILGDEVGWNVNTTRTVIKRCIQKGAIERTEPNFMCHALIAKEEVQQAQTEELINRVYDGSTDKLFAALLSRTKLSPEEIKNLKSIVDNLE